MANEVTLTVRSQLLKLVEELDKIDAKSREVSSNLNQAGKAIGDNITEQTKRTSNFLNDLQNMGRRVGDSLKDDFKALISLNAIAGSMKLSEQFRGSLKETVSLSDTIRKLGASLGIASGDFVDFQTKMTKGLGEIGASSDEAAKALEGLSGTGITGQENIMGFAKAGVQLSSLGGERGNAGQITGLIAQVIRAQGKTLNVENLNNVAKSVTQAMEASGKSATEILGNMKDIFQAMPLEQRKKTTAKGMAQLSVAETVAGPGAADAIKKFMSAGFVGRLALQQQGFSKIFTKEGGIDIEGLKAFAKEAKSRGLDQRTRLQTFGFSEQEAEGLSRLIERTDEVEKSLGKMNAASDDFSEKFHKNMSLSEAFGASLNKVKGIFAGPLSMATQGLTKVLSKASESKLGSALVVGGGGILAAMMAGGGLRGLGGALGLGGLAKSAAIEGLTGRQVMPVYVTNASDIGGGAASGIASAVGGGASALGMFGGPLGIAAGATAALSPQIGGFLGNKAFDIFGGGAEKSATDFAKQQEEFRRQKAMDHDAMSQAISKGMGKGLKVKVYDQRDRELKSATQPTRGASN